MDKRKSPVEGTMEEQGNIKVAEKSDEPILQQSIQDGLLRQHVYKTTLGVCAITGTRPVMWKHSELNAASTIMRIIIIGVVKITIGLHLHV